MILGSNSIMVAVEVAGMAMVCARVPVLRVFQSRKNLRTPVFAITPPSRGLGAGLIELAQRVVFGVFGLFQVLCRLPKNEKAPGILLTGLLTFLLGLELAGVGHSLARVARFERVTWVYAGAGRA